MNKSLTIGILILVIGCGRKPVTVPILPSTSQSDATSSTSSIFASYAEKVEVERLLVTAAQLESKGKFREALSIADRALALDSNSPRASALKSRIENLLRRI